MRLSLSLSLPTYTYTHTYIPNILELDNVLMVSIHDSTLYAEWCSIQKEHGIVSAAPHNRWKIRLRFSCQSALRLFGGHTLTIESL